jgi:putative aldouronate transport system permease protein
MVSGKIQTLDLYTYQLGIVVGKYSYSIAFGIVKSIVSIWLLFTCNTIAKKTRGDSLF